MAARRGYPLLGSCANASEPTATDAVAANEIARLRIKERETRVSFTTEQVSYCAHGLLHGPPCPFPRWLLEFEGESRPRRRYECAGNFSQNDERSSPSQLKTDLEML